MMGQKKQVVLEEDDYRWLILEVSRLRELVYAEDEDTGGCPDELPRLRALAFEEKPSSPKLAVVINWPYEMLPWNFFASFLSSDVCFEPNKTILRPVSPNSTLSGNMAVKAALDAGCEEILFLDMDQGVPRDVLARFRAHGKDVVGALTALRSYPHPWSMFDFSTDGKTRINIKPSQPLQKVDVTGGGCMLVQRRVFDAIPKPWFDTTVSEDGCSIVASSDFYFFKKVKEAGFELYIDTTVESPHYTELALHSVSLGRKLDYLEIHESPEVLENVPA